MHLPLRYLASAAVVLIAAGAAAQLEDAAATVERNKKLVADGTISRQDFDDRRSDSLVAVAYKDEADAALLRAEGGSLQTEANLAQVQATLGAAGEENAQLRAARAAVEEAQLNLEFTEVNASVDGYVTNLQLRPGSRAVANQPALALVDIDSYWVDAYFRETETERFRNGDRAVVTLMGYRDPPVEGRVYNVSSGMPVITGRYTILIPSFLYAIFCSSRPLVVGADSATAAILAAGMVWLVAVGSDQYVALAAVLAFVAAGFLMLLRRPGHGLYRCRTLRHLRGGR